MNRALVISAFLVLVCFAADANAQCLSCYTYTGQSGPGYCTWWSGAFCTRTCCYAEWGTPCNVPDFYDPCYGPSRAVFQVAMFEGGLPRPQMVPNCRLKAQMKKQQPVAIPRLGERERELAL